jgi:hypothetical protein
MARRPVFDPLEATTSEPRWYVVRNTHGAVLEVRPLASRANLKGAFVAAMLEYIDAGWQLGEFCTAGVFFCTKSRRAAPSGDHAYKFLPGTEYRFRSVITLR